MTTRAKIKQIFCRETIRLTEEAKYLYDNDLITKSDLDESISKYANMLSEFNAYVDELSDEELKRVSDILHEYP